MRRMAMLVGAVLVGGAMATPAAAQVRFGAQINWAEDADLGLGARLNFNPGQALKDKGISILTTFDYFFPDGFDYWEVAGNLVYDFKTAGSARPYVGGGLSLAHISVDLPPPLTGSASDSEIGLNLLGGIKFNPLGNVVPFVEARYAIRDGSQFVIAGGVYFGKP